MLKEKNQLLVLFVRLSGHFTLFHPDQLIVLAHYEVTRILNISENHLIGLLSILCEQIVTSLDGGFVRNFFVGGGTMSVSILRNTSITDTMLHLYPDDYRHALRLILRSLQKLLTTSIEVLCFEWLIDAFQDYGSDERMVLLLVDQNYIGHDTDNFNTKLILQFLPFELDQQFNEKLPLEKGFFTYAGFSSSSLSMLV